MSYYCNDGYGRVYRCNNGLGYGSRIGIGVGIAVAVVLLILLFSMLARKRRRRFTQQPATTIPMYQNNQQQPSNYSQGYGNGYYSQPSPYGQQGAGQAYAPPAGSPPAGGDVAHYAPPPGPPPPAYVPRQERKGAETANV
ncbi:conserved hypothetical protein [Sporisorium reilianum SRZ2]|uniref:Uncharacterized protein n=1 Tax=Sporisorium reilianum (strain SRZ2) TaxID=999809 RepID=E6ZLW4_SPORE|nr:conserved hypothetical protein [Sporisorium reilianum SRZ2]